MVRGQGPLLFGTAGEPARVLAREFRVNQESSEFVREFVGLHRDDSGFPTRMWRMRGLLVTRRMWIGAIILAVAATACSSAAQPAAEPEGSAAVSTSMVGTVASSPTTTATSPPTSLAPSPTVATTLPPIAYPVADGEIARVISVTDGDTVVVTVGGIEEKVRLIGINTPESGECLASEATNALEELVGGRRVVLGVDTNDRDQYGRLLRYIWTDDGFVNGTMVEDGWAIARRYEPDTALADLLDLAQSRAKSEGRGMWAMDACGRRAEGDIAITSINYDAPGNDGENLNGEWITLENIGSASSDLTDWVVKDESSSHRYPFPTGFVLDDGALL